MRELMLPGLMAIQYETLPVQWATIFASEEVAIPSLPVISPQMALAMGAAAVVMKNPEVSRRGLFGWFS
jgi:hypothetical protein